MTKLKPEHVYERRRDLDARENRFEKFVTRRRKEFDRERERLSVRCPHEHVTSDRVCLDCGAHLIEPKGATKP